MWALLQTQQKRSAGTSGVYSRDSSKPLQHTSKGRLYFLGIEVQQETHQNNVTLSRLDDGFLIAHHYNSVLAICSCLGFSDLRKRI